MIKRNYILLIIAGLISLTLGIFLKLEFDSKPLEFEETPQNPLERNEWRALRKGGELDINDYKKALKQVREKYKKEKISQSTTRDGLIGSWSFLGPSNVGGRIRAIVQNPENPQELFVGASSGGVWRTTDEGTSWNIISDFLPSMVITQIVYDPQNTDIMYASTGDGLISSTALPGDGILKSIDGGLTWTKLLNSNFVNNPQINDLVIDPLNTNRIFAVASNTFSEGGVYLSENSGFTWTYLQNLNGGALDIKIDPNNNSRILIGCYNKLYISNNATLSAPTFNEITGGTNQIPDDGNYPEGRIEIDISTSTPGSIYALVDRNNGEVWKSSDSGATWFLAGSNANIFGSGGQGWFDNVIWVDPTDSDFLIIGGVDLFRSTNGGATISPISTWQDDLDGPSENPNSIHADQHVILPSVNFDGTTNKTVFIGNDGGIYKTDDIYNVLPGSGWISLNQGLNITQLYGGDISSSGNFIVGGSQDNSFYFTNNGSTNWSAHTTGDGAYAAIDKNNTNIGYANTNGNQIFKTTDGGTNWEWIATFNSSSCTNSSGCFNGNLFFVNDNASLISYFRLDRNDSNILYAGAERLWRNNDEGAPPNWNTIKNTISPGVGSNANAKITTINSTIDKQTFFVGYNTGVFQRGILSGTTYSWNGNISPQTGTPTFVTDIELNPNNDNELIVSFGGYSTDNLWYCSNINTSGSLNWTNINLGINLQINAITWHPYRSDWIYVATDLGIFASEDKGQNWSVSPLYGTNGEGPTYSEISELFWREQRLCAATFSRGMWESNELREKIYVNKNHVCPFGVCSGSLSNPYTKFQDAVQAAVEGSEIIFLSEGVHNEINMDFTITKNLTITLANGPITIE